MSEHLEQVALIRWARLATNVHAELDLLFAIPNGGGRSKAEGGRLKAEGVLAGVSDLMLPVARRGYHGLFIELKTDTGRVSPQQKDFLEEVERQGYCTGVCRGWEKAKELLEWYFSTG